MAKIQKKDGSLVIKKSFWSAISIWWSFVFLLAVPFGGLYVQSKGINALLKTSFSEPQEKLIGTIALGVAVASFVLTAIVLFVKFVLIERVLTHSYIWSK